MIENNVFYYLFLILFKKKISVYFLNLFIKIIVILNCNTVVINIYLFVNRQNWPY